jgi:hypothetical protein
MFPTNNEEFHGAALDYVHFTHERMNGCCSSHTAAQNPVLGWICSIHLLFSERKHFHAYRFSLLVKYLLLVQAAMNTDHTANKEQLTENTPNNHGCWSEIW